MKASVSRVPYKCPYCERSGLYLTVIPSRDVQLGCPHGCGYVKTQAPLVEIVSDYVSPSMALDEALNELAKKKKKRVA